MEHPDLVIGYGQDVFNDSTGRQIQHLDEKFTLILNPYPIYWDSYPTFPEDRDKPRWNSDWIGLSARGELVRVRVHSETKAFQSWVVFDGRSQHRHQHFVNYYSVKETVSCIFRIWEKMGKLFREIKSGSFPDEELVQTRFDIGIELVFLIEELPYDLERYRSDLLYVLQIWLSAGGMWGAPALERMDFVKRASRELEV